MDWRWKLCCAVLYMLPWVDVTEKTVYFIERFPAFHWAEYFTEPFEHWFYVHEWAPLIIFFGTYLGIVRNKKIAHVARYHIMMVRLAASRRRILRSSDVLRRWALGQTLGTGFVLRCAVVPRQQHRLGSSHQPHTRSPPYPAPTAPNQPPQQGIMLDIVAMILIVVEENLPFGALWTPWSDLFYALMFWFVFLLVVYCLFFCFM